jgi:hypothetical protein
MSLSGFSSYSALFSTRYAKDEWAELQREFGAKFLFCVFNNNTQPIDKDAVMQVRDHLNDELDHIAVIFSRKDASEEAKEIKRRIYRETKKTIIIFEDRHLHELLDRKRNNQDPLDVIFNAVEVLQYLASKGTPMKDEHSEKRDSTVSTKTKGSAKNTVSDNAKNIQPRNPWLSGSFYLIAFVGVVALFIITIRLLPWYAFPIVIIGGILALSVIGAFQLRQDGQINENNFLKLMALSLKYLPLLRKSDAKPDNTTK